MAENGKRSGFALMDEMEQEQRTGTKEYDSEGPHFWKHYLMGTFKRAILGGLDVKLPWMMLAGMFILAVNDMVDGSPAWVSDAAAIIAIMGAAQYFLSIGIKIYRKKKNKE